MSYSEIVLFMSGVALALASIHRWYCSRSMKSSLGLAWLPRELRDAQLVYAEETFRADGEFPIVAKLDRGYRDPNGRIILVELKTRGRNRPYLSDVIELSAQRLAVQMQTGERVAEFGFVLVQRPGRVFKSIHRVDLMASSAVMALAKRREHLLSGHLPPRYACSQGMCTTCSYAQACEVSHWSGQE